MIKNNMFYGDATLKQYREIEPEMIIREYLLTKGTWSRPTTKDDQPHPINQAVHPKELVSSGLFVYGLKDNPTNRRAIEYYCERWGNMLQITDQRGFIHIPEEVWHECDEYNRAYITGSNK